MAAHTQQPEIAAPRAGWPYMVAAFAALAGVFDAAYLFIERLLPARSMVCFTGGGCEAVQNSIWSTLPPGGQGIPIALIGIFGYLTLVGLALAALNGARLAGRSAATLLLGCASLGVIVATYLTYLQAAVIGQWCSWCLISAGLQLVIWIMALVGRRTA